MSLSSYFALIGIWIAAIASPGPDVLQIIRVGTKSRAAGVACACGIMLGGSIWIVASLLGLSAVLQAAPQILALLQLVGGSYLMFMGLNALRSGLRASSAKAAARQLESVGTSLADASTDLDDVAAQPADAPIEDRFDQPTVDELTPRRAVGIGLATNLSNPKAVLFFAAVFAQFIKPGMGWGWTLVILVTLLTIGFAWFIGFALLVDKVGRLLTRHGHLVDIVTGPIFIGLALWMIAEGGKALVGS